MRLSIELFLNNIAILHNLNYLELSQNRSNIYSTFNIKLLIKKKLTINRT